MRTSVTIVRTIVGVLFIVSGLVKANDPLGLSYKMQEFFELWNTSLGSSNFFLKSPLISLFHFFHEHSLALSVIMITLEIVAGVALLLGWMKRFVLNLLLILIIFFTFLTAYAFLSGKFKNCGCFGDCLPITPFASFIKDIVLLILIVFLLAYKKYITPVFSSRTQTVTMVLSLLLSVGLQWYVLYYLPLVDCLPFKKGNNISQQMKIPAGSLPDSFAIRFVYEKGGKQFEFSPENLPADLDTYKFKDRIDKLVRKGTAEAPIKGFALNSGDMDSTEIVLNQPKAVLVFFENFSNSSSWINKLKELKLTAQQKNIPVYIVTAAPLNQAMVILTKNGLTGMQVFNCDNTVVRTAARSNPTVYLLKTGTIAGKHSFKELSQATAQLKNM